MGFAEGGWQVLYAYVLEFDSSLIHDGFER